MSLSAAEIEAVVRRVLDQIQSPVERAAGESRVTLPTSNTAVAAVAATSVGSSPDAVRTIVLPGRVITARVIEEAVRIAGTKASAFAVQLEPGAIVTPAARDALRAAGIAAMQAARTIAGGNRIAQRGSSTAPSVNGAHLINAASGAAGVRSGRAVCVVSESSSVFESTWKSVAGRGGVSRVLAGDYTDATRNAVAAIARAEFSGAFVLTSKTAAAATLANRTAAIRAAVIHNADEMAGIIADMQPNMWFVDPKRHSFSSLRRILLEGFSQ